MNNIRGEGGNVCEEVWDRRFTKFPIRNSDYRELVDKTLCTNGRIKQKVCAFN